jgi:enamine deaminase RidA (YjgF/YER057c/UK114 family)
MTNTTIQPPGIVEIPGLTQVIVASGSRHVYVAGQIPIDPAGELIGAGDLQTQAIASFRNLRTCLDAAGATPADVVKVTFWIVGYTPESLDAVYTAAFEVFGADVPAATSTLVGVSALYHPGQLFEVDAVAVLD